MRPLEETLEEENKDKLNSLGMKVSQLKDIALQIHDHASTDVNMLGQMNNKYGNASDMVTGTIRKLEDTLKGQSTVVCCYLVAIIVFMIWVLYKLGS